MPELGAATQTSPASKGFRVIRRIDTEGWHEYFREHAQNLVGDTARFYDAGDIVLSLFGRGALRKTYDNIPDLKSVAVEDMMERIEAELPDSAHDPLYDVRTTDMLFGRGFEDSNGIKEIRIGLEPNDVIMNEILSVRTGLEKLAGHEPAITWVGKNQPRFPVGEHEVRLDTKVTLDIRDMKPFSIALLPVQVLPVEL